ncbi:hypothetical protein [Ruegeria sp. AU67]|uniref:hypothetical protein n=1 Tax=Ruegeria sp. AU67 TaxID=2108530 RepID=UPI000D68EED1|nr:hypothetical protein [Ruegeria sp. AU67]
MSMMEAVGRSQSFNRGFADGVFFTCNGGLSATYNVYENDAFFQNPEFELFLPYREGMELSSERLFVHRISCTSNGFSAIYPFMTNEARKSAWYLFEGGVFSLFAP